MRPSMDAINATIATRRWFDRQSFKRLVVGPDDVAAYVNKVFAELPDTDRAYIMQHYKREKV